MRPHPFVSALLGAFFAVWPASSVCRAQALRPAAPPALGAVSASAPQPWVAQASVIGYLGVVEIKKAGQAVGGPVNALPVRLSPGDKLRTGPSGSATLQFKDGSKATVGPVSVFAVEEERAEQVTLHLLLGKVWLAVAKLERRRFRVRTPTAVCSVRGTEFSVEALGASGASRTAVEVFGGLVSVRGTLGDEALIGASQRVDVIEGRMGAVERFEARPDSRMPAPAAESSGGRDKERREQGRPEEKGRMGFAPERFKEFVAGQVGEQMRRDLIESGAAFDQKSQIYQEGKTLIDAFGRRVRVEEYLKRPSADTFKFVSFNFRDNRTDFASVEVTANSALPERLADAGNLWFSPGASLPAFYAVKQRLTMSNGADSVVQLGVDGAPQLFTFAGQPIFDSTNNTFLDSPGGSFRRTMFGNKYEFINGNPAAVNRIWSEATFRPVDNGLLSGTDVTGMMWRTQPVHVRIRDISVGNLGEYWTDAFVGTAAGANGMAYAQTTFQPSPGLAHFVSRRSYFNFTDTNNNGILDFGERDDPVNAGFFHDVIERMDGTTLVAAVGAGIKQAGGDTLIFSDRDGNGAPGGADPFVSNAALTMPLALGFARDNSRDWLEADEFAIDDFGQVLAAGGDFNASASLFTGVNFERRLRSSKFSGPDIDVVMSPNFLFLSGASNAANQDRPIPSPGPKQ